MIYKKCVMTIDKNKATLDEDIYLYRLDKNIELYFTIVNNRYRFNKGDMNNIILITNASFFQVRLYKNAEIKYTFAIQPTDGGQAILPITDDLIDDPIEVGDYDFQISLLDEEKTSMISMPIVSKQLHVCEPLVSDDATMGKAILGLSKLATGEIKNAFDSEGNYIREIHQDGDILSASIINKFEEALDTNTKAIKNGTGTSYDDTEIKTDINTIKTDLGTEELTTTAKDIKGAVNEVAAQYKDIANLSLTKHTDGKIYIKKQDGTLVGTGVEVGNDVDLSKITMSMSGQTLKLMNDGTQITSVEIPTATVTDEQLTSIIQSKIDDGTLASIALGNNSVSTSNIQDDAVTEAKVSFLDKTQHSKVVNTYDSSKTNWGKTTSDGTNLTDYSNTEFGVSDYTEIIPNTEITIDHIQTGLSSKVWYYDKQKTLLGNITVNSSGNQVITITNKNAKYIRFHCSKSSTKSVLMNLTTYTYKLKKDLIDNNINYDFSNTMYVDQYDESTCTEGLLLATGNIQANVSFMVTDYIDIIPNTEIIIAVGNTSWPCAFCYYDEDKKYIGYVKSVVGSENTLIVTDENAKYIRYNVIKNTKQYVLTKIKIPTLVVDKFNSFIPKSVDNTTNDYTCLTGEATKELIDTIDFNRSKWKGKKIIVDGDSITHFGQWHIWLKEWFEWATVYNHACSGQSLTILRNANDASGVGQGLKGYERVQQNYEADADAIILMGDGNNCGNKNAIGVYSDTTEDTWCGRMNLMLDAITTKYPTKPIILISNPPRGETNRHGINDSAHVQANAMKDLAWNRGFYYIDCYHTNLYRPNIPQNVTLFGNNGKDITHPNNLGHKMMAQMIFEELKKVGFDF